MSDADHSISGKGAVRAGAEVKRHSHEGAGPAKSSHAAGAVAEATAVPSNSAHSAKSPFSASQAQAVQSQEVQGAPEKGPRLTEEEEGWEEEEEGESEFDNMELSAEEQLEILLVMGVNKVRD